MRIVISGNIGCGKTTQIKRLQEYFATEDNIKIIPEGVQEWIDEGWLQKYYDDPKTWALPFQYRVLASQTDVPDMEDGLIIIERSPHTTQHIFSKQLTEDGIITPEGFQGIVQHNINNSWNPDAFIYVRVSPEICFERMKLRNRNAESMISLDYLKKLHDRHEVLHLENEANLCPSFIIDGSKSIDEVTAQLMKAIFNISIENSKMNCTVKYKEKVLNTIGVGMELEPGLT